MTKTHTPPITTFCLVVSMLCFNLSFACSGFKITANGKTFVGNNEDSWRINPKLWFVPASEGKYGVVYVGANSDDMSEGAVNEKGLMYDGFTIATKPSKPNGTEKAPKSFLREIMQTCATVEDVKEKLKKYNRYFFDRGMLFMVDRNGQYLVIEPDTIVEGNDPKYILTNFCPSITDVKDVPQKRYWRGKAFIEHRNNADLATALGMMDTMSECRPRFGDGTMYTSLYDLDSGNIYLYFYHDYTHEVKLNIAEELAKGERKILLASLFPSNAEYEKIRAYHTPFNDNKLLGTLLISAAMLLLFALFYLVSYIRTRQLSGAYIKLLLAVVNVGLAYYLWLIARNEGVYYFPAPYNDGYNKILAVLSYLPIALALLIIPIIILNIRSIKSTTWSKPATTALITNTVLYLLLLALFSYWGFLIII